MNKHEDESYYDDGFRRLMSDLKLEDIALGIIASTNAILSIPQTHLLAMMMKIPYRQWDDCEVIEGKTHYTADGIQAVVRPEWDPVFDYRIHITPVRRPATEVDNG